MRILRAPSDLTDADRGASVALGNFDGVHLGHQAVIAEAKAAGSPWGVMTFEPHPRGFFAPSSPPFRLMNAEARAHRLDKLGAHVLMEVPFDASIAALSPREFVSNVLIGDYGLSHVVTGQDFRFGQDRVGNAARLEALGAELGLDVSTAPMVDLGGLEVSSTAIRRALSEGRPGDAAKMLGHWHRIDGSVLHGEKRGRELGYPTANMSIAGLHPPKFGVYAVWVDVLTGPHAGTYQGAASIGVRPQFDGEVANCESYLFDFSGDLYGQELSVALVDFLRPEMTFDGVDGLIAQMEADCARAREILDA